MRAGNVPFVVRGPHAHAGHVHLEHHDARVLGMLREPVGGDDHVALLRPDPRGDQHGEDAEEECTHDTPYGDAGEWFPSRTAQCPGRDSNPQGREAGGF